MRSARAAKSKASVEVVELDSETDKPVANGSGRKSKKGKASTKRKAKPTKPAAKRTKKEEEQYDVEEVKGVMVKGNVTSYFIKWSGYPESKNSWEPSQNVASEALVRKFLETALASVPQNEEDVNEDDE